MKYICKKAGSFKDCEKCPHSVEHDHGEICDNNCGRTDEEILCSPVVKEEEVKKGIIKYIWKKAVKKEEVVMNDEKVCRNKKCKHFDGGAMCNCGGVTAIDIIYGNREDKWAWMLKNMRCRKGDFELRMSIEIEDVSSLEKIVFIHKDGNIYPYELFIKTGREEEINNKTMGKIKWNVRDENHGDVYSEKVKAGEE